MASIFCMLFSHTSITYFIAFFFGIGFKQESNFFFEKVAKSLVKTKKVKVDVVY